MPVTRRLFMLPTRQADRANTRCENCDHANPHKRVTFDGAQGYCERVIYEYQSALAEGCRLREFCSCRHYAQHDQLEVKA